MENRVALITGAGRGIGSPGPRPVRLAMCRRRYCALPVEGSMPSRLTL